MFLIARLLSLGTVAALALTLLSWLPQGSFDQARRWAAQHMSRATLAVAPDDTVVLPLNAAVSSQRQRTVTQRRSVGTYEMDVIVFSVECDASAECAALIIDMATDVMTETQGPNSNLPQK